MSRKMTNAQAPIVAGRFQGRRSMLRSRKGRAMMATTRIAGIIRMPMTDSAPYQQDLARVEELWFMLGLKRIFTEWSRRSGLAKKENVGCHKSKDACGDQENMCHEKS